MMNKKKGYKMQKIDKKKLKFIIFDTLFSIFYLLLLYFFTFMMQGHSIKHNFELIKSFIFAGRIRYMVIPYLIILNEFLVIKSFVKDNFKTNVITTVFTVIITIISFYKYRVLELPFLPSDVLLIGNAGEIAKFGLTAPPISINAIPLMLAIVLGIYYVIRKPYYCVSKKAPGNPPTGFACDGGWDSYKKEKLTIKHEWYRIILFIVRNDCNI